MARNDTHEMLDGWRDMDPEGLDGRRALLTTMGGTVIDGPMRALGAPDAERRRLVFREAPCVTAAVCTRTDGAWHAAPCGRSLIVYVERPNL